MTTENAVRRVAFEATFEFGTRYQADWFIGAAECAGSTVWRLAAPELRETAVEARR